MMALQSCKEMEKEVLATIDLAGVLCNQRSQPELVKLVKKLLPPYFGFEAVGVMLRD